LEVWVGVVKGHVLSLVQDQDQNMIHYEFLNKRHGDKRIKVDEEEFLRNYFQLHTSLTDLYKHWSDVDPVFKKTAAKFPGVRVMNQDPVENVFSFICATANNIKRIQKMVEAMCLEFGDHLFDDPEFGPLHAFPSVESLSKETVTPALTRLGFGFRAKYISCSAKMIISGGIKPLETLSSPSTPSHETRTELMKLSGVGKKVADCISLFSMAKTEPIPVDTHVYQIACKLYKMKGLDPNKSNSVSDKKYKEIANFFQTLFGSHAGWAHSVLFTADLKL